MQNNLNLMGVAPSVFAQSPDSNVSDKYTFIRTWDIVEKLNELGWFAVDAKQTGRKKTNPHARHMIILENKDYVSRNGVTARVYVHNSHNRTKRFQIGIGFFVRICSNGLIVKDENEFSDEYKVKHINVIVDNVQEVIDDIIKRFEVHYERIEQYRQITLTEDEKIKFALEAIKLRYSKEKNEIDPNNILITRHAEYEEANLWNVFNIIQENLMNGGTEYKSKKGRNLKTRKVNSLDREVYFNENLWMIMEGIRTSKML